LTEINIDIGIEGNLPHKTPTLKQTFPWTSASGTGP